MIKVHATLAIQFSGFDDPILLVEETLAVYEEQAIYIASGYEMLLLVSFFRL